MSRRTSVVETTCTMYREMTPAQWLTMVTPFAQQLSDIQYPLYEQEQGNILCLVTYHGQLECVKLLLKYNLYDINSVTSW
jgi:hypothetical protein